METKLKKYIELKRKDSFDDLKNIYPYSLFETYDQYEQFVILKPYLTKDTSWYDYLKSAHKIGNCLYIDCPICLGDWVVK